MESMAENLVTNPKKIDKKSIKRTLFKSHDYIKLKNFFRIPHASASQITLRSPVDYAAMAVFLIKAFKIRRFPIGHRYVTEYLSSTGVWCEIDDWFLNAVLSYTGQEFKKFSQTSKMKRDSLRNEIRSLVKTLDHRPRQSKEVIATLFGPYYITTNGYSSVYKSKDNVRDFQTELIPQDIKSYLLQRYYLSEGTLGLNRSDLLRFSERFASLKLSIGLKRALFLVSEYGPRLFRKLNENTQDVNKRVVFFHECSSIKDYLTLIEFGFDERVPIILATIDKMDRITSQSSINIRDTLQRCFLKNSETNLVFISYDDSFYKRNIRSSDNNFLWHIRDFLDSFNFFDTNRFDDEEMCFRDLFFHGVQQLCLRHRSCFIKGRYNFIDGVHMP